MTLRDRKTYMVYSNGQFVAEKIKIESVWNASLKLIQHEKELESKSK